MTAYKEVDKAMTARLARSPLLMFADLHAVCMEVHVHKVGGVRPQPFIRVSHFKCRNCHTKKEPCASVCVFSIQSSETTVKVSLFFTWTWSIL